MILRFSWIEIGDGGFEAILGNKMAGGEVALPLIDQQRFFGLAPLFGVRAPWLE